MMTKRASYPIDTPEKEELYKKLKSLLALQGITGTDWFWETVEQAITAPPWVMDESRRFGRDEPDPTIEEVNKSSKNISFHDTCSKCGKIKVEGKCPECKK